jgi:hypothetical protein
VSPPRFVKNPFTGKELPVSVGTAYLDEFTCLHDRGESWVFEIPPGLVQELGDASQLEGVAAKWAQYEELQGAGPEVLLGVLVDLQRLAQLARAQNRSLLLWTVALASGSAGRPSRTCSATRA